MTSLSDKIFAHASFTTKGAIKTEDVREAVKELKEQLFLVHTDLARKELIDETFGEKLC